MKICCISDMHGYLPKLPKCDLVLIGGDIVPTTMHKPLFSKLWLESAFQNWLKSLRTPVIGVAGNHDFIFQDRPEDVPKLKWTYLQDSGTEFDKYKVWGSPWQTRFYNWAFNADEPDLKEKWSLIPKETDILLLHGPPFGYGDMVDRHIGSPSLLEKIEEIKPKLVVFGHIHSGYGQYNIGDTILVNAAYVDESYKPKNNPIVVEI